jgi:hypothetical protein
MNRRWIPAVVIWAWLIASLALVKSHPWLKTLWNAVWLLVLLVIAIASVIHVFRHRQETEGLVGYPGVASLGCRTFRRRRVKAAHYRSLTLR